MNVFKAAMSIIQQINKNQSVIIRNKTSVFNEYTGLYEQRVTEIEAVAQVQTTPSSVQDIADTATNSYNIYELWFVNLTPVIVDSLVSTNILNTEVVLKNGVVLVITEKEDYSYNGWIYCKGVQYASI